MTEPPTLEEPRSELQAREMRTGAAPLRSPAVRRFLLGVAVLVCSLALIPTALNANQNQVSAQHAQPTATATATPASTATAIAGYTPFVDSADGFALQYPVAWSCSASNPGVDCIDSPDTQSYRLQVQVPGDWTSADTGGDPNDSAAWVNFALSAFSDVPGRTYERLPGSSSVTIGGTKWQGGAAIISMEQATSATVTPSAAPVRIHIQVYATVHNNKPYIIALYAEDERFSSGTKQYFQPMLNSFAFLSDQA
jgi:hypothetical protein